MCANIKRENECFGSVSFAPHVCVCVCVCVCVFTGMFVNPSCPSLFGSFVCTYTAKSFSQFLVKCLSVYFVYFDVLNVCLQAAL